MASLKDRLQEILIRDKHISSKDLDCALKEQKKSGGELSKILVKLKIIDEDVLAQVLSEGLGLPPINMDRLKVDPDIAKIIPKETASKYQIMPISLMGDHLTLAMADPLNIFVIDNVKVLTGYKINPIIGRPNDIAQTIEKYYPESEKKKEDIKNPTDTFNDIIKDIQDTGELELIKDAQDEGGKAAVEDLTDEAPIIKLTDTIIQQGVAAKASDIFIEPLEKTMRIRYRIDGIVREIDRMTKVLHFPIVSRIKVISNLDISEHRLPQDGRFKTIIAGEHSVDFRVNVLPTAFGEKVVLRILDQDAAFLNIDKLGFEERSLERLKESAIQPHGMILACGPTGSGKTTTLYSILKYVDSPEKNIVTVEDPVEFQMKGMSQVNIKPAMGLTFPVSLRSILRQDPDIIMIGEIRDKETLDIAVKAALTGHLVLSSLHTTTAAGSIIRMRNMGIEPFLICSSVLAIVAQRLLRRTCTYCKESYEASPTIIDKFHLKKIFPKDTKKFELFQGKGCKRCFETGYKGRVGITEVFMFSPKIRELILARASETKLKEVARAEGMQTMREDGVAKVVEGLTTLEEVSRITAPDEAKPE
ncbi:MAG: Flp pilus assembly complex ATPase component TadA [Candidatus Omnitrophica bacterium]|nr:Flp pilus assembly complex ATPase component TadA [Candidatus Omnitrophota bacterium]MCK5259849.1 Flp pilus assembly complex ATPase component TadA [Candidatus Omnitrophota bacterium]